MTSWHLILLTSGVVVVGCAIYLTLRIGLPNIAFVLDCLRFLKDVAIKVAAIVKGLKAYHEPKDFPQAPPEEPTNVANFTVGEKRGG